MIPLMLGSAAVSAAAMTVSAAAAEDTPEQTAAGWQTADGKRFFYSEEGAPYTGEVEIDGQYYLFAPNGAQQVGWQTVNGKRYYYDPETGEPVFGTVIWRGETYYVTPEDGKSVDEQLILPDGIRQTDSEGVMLTGWQMLEEQPHYFSENGIMQTGWLILDGARYYFDETGVLQTGWLTLEGQRYCFSESGVMLTGWQTLAGENYNFGTDGIMQTGITEYRGTVVYRSEDGSRLTGWYTDEAAGNTYYFDENGAGVHGMQEIGGSGYYFNERGIMQTGAVTVGGHTYIFGEDGCGLSGFQTIDGKLCYVRENHMLMTADGDDGILSVDDVQIPLLSEGDNRVCLAEDGSVAFAFTVEDDTLTYTAADGTTYETDLAEKTNLGLAYYAIRKLGCAYWYGTYGQTASEALFKSYKKIYPTYYTKWDDYGTQYGGQVFDCAGLIKAYLWSETVDGVPVPKSESNATSTGMYDLTEPEQRGTIESCPWTVGTLVFRSDSWSSRKYGIHHVGVYIGNGMVVEAKGHTYGVVLSTDMDFWTHWAQCPWTEDAVGGDDENEDQDLSES